MDDVVVRDLKTISDDRGFIKHIFKKSYFATMFDAHEVYLSCIYPGIVKGWHLHRRQTQNYVCISGNIKLVLYDARPASKSSGELCEIFMGDLNHLSVSIPPGVWNGYTCVGGKPASIINVTNFEHDPSEMERIDPWETEVVGYKWGPVDK